MKVHTHHSVVLANKVLAAIRKLAERSPYTDDIFVSCYSNCREQGWALNRNEQMLTISEHRNSDDIRIWYGPRRRFEITGHIPTEHDSIRSRTFESTKQGINEAAAFAFYFLIFDLVAADSDTTTPSPKKRGKRHADANF